MKTVKLCIAACIICISLLITGCGKPGAETASETVPGSPEESVSEAAVDYGQIKGDFSGMTLEMAKAYLAVVDDIAAHLGYNEKEAAPDEYLHGGFICDWDGDGTPDMCLLLKTSPRESGNWEGTPLYGWNAPTLRLYTFKDGQAVLAGESDLYFATAGREAAVSALKTDNGLQTVWFDRNDITEEGYAVCFELKDGAIQKKDAPAEMAQAAQNAATAEAFLASLGAGNTQMLLYNYSGDARIGGEANARELRDALAAKAA